MEKEHVYEQTYRDYLSRIAEIANAVGVFESLSDQIKTLEIKEISAK